MIMVEEGSERALMRSLQKEQERERRRIRDRQRRQSMSVEEREKHLARRRRNYQLRRQRAENARLDLRVNQNTTTTTTTTTSTTSSSTTLAAKSNDYPPLISVSIVDAQCNVGLNSGHKNSVGLEIPAHILAKLPRRLRLNHLKHLARSLDDPVDISNNHIIAADLIIRGNVNANSSCVPPKGLRLNRVKWLARSLNSDIEKAKGENHQSHEEEQNLSNRELQLQMLSMSNNVSKVDQTCNVKCGKEWFLPL
ncbi:hypothetical protein P3X46_004807 [Hevea brasiliensis]|uniref:Uncharacterized protein n=1 Tax=Hevea brasiliensis TaxID=3981 RepID=A0ABQ9MXW2_HEVBR|nr:uncharacterized protein LOC110666670 isoform X2 [Hevea brasiliensis]KAJ9185146.1 hypothetical protein P3X46_004807 [Hevea brasiliensis]